MSSDDHFLLDGSYNSNSDMVSSDLDLQFLCDPFFPFENSPPDDILQPLSIDSNQQFTTDQHPNPLSSVTNNNPFNFSPPSHELNNLSLQNETQFQSSLPNSGFFSSSDGLTDFSGLNNNSSTGVKLEDCYVGFDSSSSSFSPHLVPENNNFNSEKMMQRSFSSHSLDRKPSFFFQPRFNSLLEVPNFPTQILGSPENTAFSGPMMRKVSSTGDLQKFKRTHSSHGFSSSPLAAENPLMEEVTFKARPYNAEERKQRIHRYRSKRTQRNFSKTIKYACRKTLADSRPRVRGRFARNDETSEIPKVTDFSREEDDEDDLLWVDRFYEENETRVLQGGDNVLQSCFNSPSQFQYFGPAGSCSFSWKPALSSTSQVLQSD
ncbi:CCT domain [Macleaya cordata]|uniref:CCT domain n=1 Tax=Macleaya cordata TaxID=56857 RepID=A0A200QU38_MACCD|nr:CCT domain [Macleaya cordata]